MRINAYLVFDGDCAAAFKRYHEIFGGEITAMLDHTAAPPGTPMPPNWGDRIMHACLEIDGTKLMGSDRPAGGHKAPEGMTVQVEVETPQEADRVFAALSDGGKVTMPIAETFWAHRFGAVTDRYGIPFMVNCGKF